MGSAVPSVCQQSPQSHMFHCWEAGAGVTLHQLFLFVHLSLPAVDTPAHARTPRNSTQHRTAAICCWGMWRVPRAATKQMLLTQPFSNGPRDSPGQTVMKVPSLWEGNTPASSIYQSYLLSRFTIFCLKRLTAINNNRTCTGQARLYWLMLSIPSAILCSKASLFQ